MELKFGITMRVTNPSEYDEPRDSIARDWSDFMLCNFPNAKFLFIPNIGKNVIDYIKKWNIDVLIFSGGDDLGKTLDRDNTENILLEYALKVETPIIAVCRGLQLVHTYFGGEIKNGEEEFVFKHRAVNHNIITDTGIVNVNSYHTNRIDENSVHKDFEIFARCEMDNSIEGLRNRNILGVMWHPERKNLSPEYNKLLLENFLKSYEK